MTISLIERQPGPFEARVDSICEGVSVFTFGKKSIEELRRQYFALMRNLPRVKTLSDFDAVWAGVSKFRDLLEDLFFDSFRYVGGKGSFVVAYKAYALKNWRHQRSLYDEMLEYRLPLVRQSAWDFWMLLGEVQKIRNSNRDIRFGKPEINTKKVRTVRERARKAAKKFFDTLTYFLVWFEKKADDNVEVSHPVTYNAEMAGFQVALRGYNPNLTDHIRDRKKVRAALELVRKQAARRYPKLLRGMLPIVAHFSCETLDSGGEYHGKNIQACTDRYKYKTPEEFAHVVVHEMGHHVWNVWLPSAATEWWTKAVKADYSKFNLNKLLQVWGDERWLSQVRDKIVATDPVLSIQIDILQYFADRDRRFAQLTTKDGVEQAIRSGVTIQLPKNPISWYAHKNPEEAFCEAFGKWVVYGERFLPSLVLSNLKYVLGVG